MAVMIVPILLIMIQVESRYAFRSLEPGEKAILSVKNRRGTEPIRQMRRLPVAPTNLCPGDPFLTCQFRSREIYWRIQAQRRGEYFIKIRIGEEDVTRRIVVGEAKAVSPYMFRANDILSLLYPSTPAIEGTSQVISILPKLPKSPWSISGDYRVLRGFSLPPQLFGELPSRDFSELLF